MSDEQTLSRRGILRLGSIAGGLLLPFAGGQAVASMAAVAATSSAVAGTHIVPSSELVAWRAARTAYWDAVERVQDCRMAGRRARVEAHALFESPEYVALDAEMDVACRVLDAAVGRIRSRPVRSVYDLAELAEMVRGEKWWNPGEYDPEADDAPDPDVIAVFDAISALAARTIKEV